MYYAFIQDNKINGIGQCPCSGQGIECVEITEEQYNDIARYMWNGSAVVENQNYEQEEYERQYQEAKSNRESAYAGEVDNITAHINRLHDEEQTPEIIQEIEELKAERTAKVEEIKQRYPYPTPPTESE